MPGIVGIIRRIPYEGIEADLRLMTGVMKHERFYTSGEYTNADVGLYAGWTSHQDSFADCMPVVCQNGNVVIVLQGENYVDGDTLARLRNKHGVIDESNAKYLGLLYDEFGNDFLRRLNGWFSGFIVNLESQKITLFNDRYGMGRIYYHEGNGEFLFASEAKALLRVRPNLRTIDVGSVAQYLRCDCVMGNKTLFKDICCCLTDHLGF